MSLPYIELCSGVVRPVACQYPHREQRRPPMEIVMKKTFVAPVLKSETTLTELALTAGSAL